MIILLAVVLAVFWLMDGAVLMQLIMVSVVGWIMSVTTEAVGSKPMANLIKGATVFTCISLGAGALWNAIHGMIESFNEKMEVFRTIANFFS